MKLTRIQVTIDPWRYSDTDDLTLKIKVKAGGRELNYENVILRADDFNTVLTVLWMRQSTE